MEKRLKLWIVLLASLLIVPSSAFAQAVDNVNIRQIFLYSDAMHAYVDISGGGEAIDTPANNEIIATVDNKRMNVKNVSTFSDSGEGMSYIFLIDISGSLSGRQFSALKNATKTWADKLSEQDRMAILTFGNEAAVVQDFTADKDSICSSVDSIQNNDGNTKLFGGIDEALKLCSRNDAGLPKRKAIILLTDGVNDFAGGIGEAEVIKEARESSVPVYSIWTPGGQSGVGESFLNTLSDSTNGNVYNLSKQDIESIYTTVFDGFHKSFVIDLSYPSDIADGGLHSIKFTVRHEEKEASDDTDCVLKPSSENMISIPTAASTSANTEKENGFMSPVILTILIAIILLFVAIAIFVVAILSRKKRTKFEYPMSARIDYTPQNANIGKELPLAEPALPKRSGRNGIGFTLTEIGGKKVFNGNLSDSTVIGRSEDCDVTIHDSKISARHCKITREEGQVMIEDLNSTNGTIVNGIAISAKVRLENGDSLLLGGREYRINY